MVFPNKRPKPKPRSNAKQLANRKVQAKYTQNKSHLTADMASRVIWAW